MQQTGGEENGTDLATMLRSTGHRSAVASRLPAPHMTLRAGTHIPCTLETAITSSLPGSTRCITAADTWSADGSVVVIERGTTIFGETRGVASQGNHRIFVIWTHAYTPLHIVVPLEAPGTDALGRSGVAGEVNYHFFQRFGAALFISVIDGAVQAASRSRAGNNSVVISPNPSRDLVTEILRQTANIRATVDTHHGAQVQVAVPRNVDFGAVYELMQSDEP
ncbi:TrbI/VirB10 family protein [Steroidobacter agaridevorans]|uniref:TrbI/VirB10 family protein n=1 Tax=Steroidobacter agaridevorans TaxID=2695856 RepID=UPI00137B3C3A|nr:TrbI/VirB10 family protein [Steroidobacter agaridevorans]